jgi:hypothetical protein
VVRLYFAEPDDIGAGERLFSVALQGVEVLPALDIVAEAGAPRQALMREFVDVHAADTLEVSLAPLPGSPRQETVLSGLAVLIDTDGDWLCDLDETALGTDPEYADGDGDGLTDYEEVWYDGDGGYDPYDAISNPEGTDLDTTRRDTDGDGVDDGVELRYGTDPLSSQETPELPLAPWLPWGMLGVFMLLASSIIAFGLSSRRRRWRCRPR